MPKKISCSDDEMVEVTCVKKSKGKKVSPKKLKLRSPKKSKPSKKSKSPKKSKPSKKSKSPKKSKPSKNKKQKKSPKKKKTGPSDQNTEILVNYLIDLINNNKEAASGKLLELSELFSLLSYETSNLANKSLTLDSNEFKPVIENIVDKPEFIETFKTVKQLDADPMSALQMLTNGNSEALMGVMKLLETGNMEKNNLMKLLGTSNMENNNSMKLLGTGNMEKNNLLEDDNTNNSPEIDNDDGTTNNLAEIDD